MESCQVRSVVHHLGNEAINKKGEKMRSENSRMRTIWKLYCQLSLIFVLLLTLLVTAHADNVLEVETEKDVVIWADSDLARLGQSMVIGDFNGDGKDDVAIGAPQQHSEDGTTDDVGFVSVLFGGAAMEGLDGKVTPNATDTGMEGLRIFGTTDRAYVGQLLAAGDLNNDGKDDLIIVSQYNNNKYELTRIYVIYGKSSFDPNELNMPDDADVVMQRDEARISSLAVGEISGDDFEDLILCDNWKERVYVLYGAAANWNAAIDLSADSDVVITRNGGVGGTNDTGDLFYANAQSALGDQQGLAIGDMNKDGISDIVLGVPKEEANGRTNGGVVYMFYGKNNFPASLDVDAAELKIRGGVANDEIGASLAMGDVNGDGYGDMIIGAPESMVGVSGSSAGVGKVQVVYGASDLSGDLDMASQADITLMLSEDVRNIGDKTGYALLAEDLSGDDVADIVISSPWAKLKTSANGWIHVVYGGSSLASSYELDKIADIRILAPDPTADLARGLMGTSLGVGDLNSDGNPDIIMGAPEGISGNTKGFAAIIFDPAQKAVIQGISGTLTTTVTGQSTGVSGATITIVEAGQSATSDSDGSYTIADVPVGTYTVTIEKQGFSTQTLENVSVSEGTKTDLSEKELVLAACDGLKGDINDDGVIDLKEAIHALQVAAGVVK